MLIAFFHLALHVRFPAKSDWFSNNHYVIALSHFLFMNNSKYRNAALGQVQNGRLYLRYGSSPQKNEAEG